MISPLVAATLAANPLIKTYRFGGEPEWPDINPAAETAIRDHCRRQLLDLFGLDR